MNIVILTVSDRAARGEYQDRSGPEAERLLRMHLPTAQISRVIVADEPDRIVRALDDAEDADFVLTTGGTGIGPRDVTPEATAAFCERLLPGIAEAIRERSLAETPFAMLSRGVAGQKDRTIVVNLPGSVKAIETCLDVVIPIMEHAVAMMQGEGHEMRRDGC